MSLILNIDTATELASVSIAKDGELLASELNPNQKDHGAFVQPAIKRVLEQAEVSLGSIDAIAVMAGPGSYTGLRVGMASAKGLCYALKRPLILVNTLEALTFAAIQNAQSADKLFCPMLDARRDEVFTAIYDATLTPILAPCALILDEKSYASYLADNQIVFFGNGSEKWKKSCSSHNAIFQRVNIDSSATGTLSYKQFTEKRAVFQDSAHLEPLYIKEFYEK